MSSSQPFGKPVKPRWPRGKKKPEPAPVVVIKGRTAQKQLAALQAVGNQAAGKNDALAKTGAWRYRRHLSPFLWLSGLLLAGLILPGMPHPVVIGMGASIVVPVVMVAFTRHLSAFAATWTTAASVITGLWFPFLATFGLHPHVLLAVLLLTWAPFCGLWVNHYGSFTEEPEPQAIHVPDDDMKIWGRLAAKRNWSAELADPEAIPSGRRYRIVIDGAENDIGDILSMPRKVAAAYGRAQTEAYVEPAASGIESEGVLTLLDGDTLSKVRHWDGTGADPATGIARIASFADGTPAHVRFWEPRNGTKHGLIAGATGGGKSFLLDLITRSAVASGRVIPVILDPQNGQSLPQWMDHALYASGLEECVTFLRGLHAGLMDRSERLSRLTWTDGDGHTRRGMGFFDPDLTGLPMIMILGDEFPLVLSGAGNPKLAGEVKRLSEEIAKLGRKTGVAFWPVVQVPSLAELANSQVLRSMLVGGNVVCLRTGDKVSAGMIALKTDPSQLPRTFRDGSSTAGLGYVVGPDNRQAPARMLLVPPAIEREMPAVPPLDDRFAAAMKRAIEGTVVALPFKPAPAATRQPVVAEVQPEPEQEGRTCADAVWLALCENGADMTRAQVLDAVTEIATVRWKREKPFVVRAVGDALAKLSEGKYDGKPVIANPDPAKPARSIYRAASDAMSTNDHNDKAA